MTQEPSNLQDLQQIEGRGVNFKHVSPTTKAYRDYLNARWMIEIKEDGYSPRFTNRNPPAWMDPKVRKNVTLITKDTRNG